MYKFPFLLPELALAAPSETKAESRSTSKMYELREYKQPISVRSRFFSLSTISFFRAISLEVVCQKTGDAYMLGRTISKKHLPFLIIRVSYSFK